MDTREPDNRTPFLFFLCGSMLFCPCLYALLSSTKNMHECDICHRQQAQHLAWWSKIKTSASGFFSIWKLQHVHWPLFVSFRIAVLYTLFTRAAGLAGSSPPLSPCDWIGECRFACESTKLHKLALYFVDLKEHVTLLWPWVKRGVQLHAWMGKAIFLPYRAVARLKEWQHTIPLLDRQLLSCFAVCNNDFYEEHVSK